MALLQLIHNIMVWHNTQLGDDNIITVGQAFLTDIRENRISMRTSASGLKLSMSLKSMEPGRTAPLLTQHPRGEAEVAMPELDQFGDTPFTLRTPPGAPPILQVPIPGEDTAEKKTRAYTFIAAYLMRLLVKDAANAVAGLGNMKQRFESFYGRSRIGTSFVITLQQAAVYKEALRSQVMISNTYSLALAYDQNAASANHSPREENLLCYLGYLPFSYTGLHAYTLMANLKNFTNIEIGMLLTLFQVDINRPALNKIADIIGRYERTVTNPARSTYFRYCAL